MQQRVARTMATEGAGLEVATYMGLWMLPLVSKIEGKNPNGCHCLSPQHPISGQDKGGEVAALSRFQFIPFQIRGNTEYLFRTRIVEPETKGFQR